MFPLRLCFQNTPQCVYLFVRLILSTPLMGLLGKVLNRFYALVFGLYLNCCVCFTLWTVPFQAKPRFPAAGVQVKGCNRPVFVCMAVVCTPTRRRYPYLRGLNVCFAAVPARKLQAFAPASRRLTLVCCLVAVFCKAVTWVIVCLFFAFCDFFVFQFFCFSVLPIFAPVCFCCIFFEKSKNGKAEQLQKKRA